MNASNPLLNKLAINFGDASQAPEVTVNASDSTKIASLTASSSGAELELSLAKLSLNGTQLALKEVTVGDTTLSVLAAV